MTILRRLHGGGQQVRGCLAAGVNEDLHIVLVRPVQRVDRLLGLGVCICSRDNLRHTPRCHPMSASGRMGYLDGTFETDEFTNLSAGNVVQNIDEDSPVEPGSGDDRAGRNP